MAVSKAMMLVGGSLLAAMMAAGTAGAQTISVENAASVPATPPTFDDLLAELRIHYSERDQHSIDVATARAVEAEARADAAEAALARIKAAFA